MIENIARERGIVGNHLLKGIGTIEPFKLDTKIKSISLQLNLEGEEGRLFSLSIGKYEVTQEGDASFFRIIECTSSD